jgi:uncharacterized protein
MEEIMLEPIANGKYMAVKSFKKNGEGVITPVWVCKVGEKLFIWTSADSWKVKRIRNRADVQICSSDGRGNPKGEWVKAQAVIRDEASISEQVRNAMIKKYGLLFQFFNMMGKIYGSTAHYVAVEFII